MPLVALGEPSRTVHAGGQCIVVRAVPSTGAERAARLLRDVAPAPWRTPQTRGFLCLALKVAARAGNAHPGVHPTRTVPPGVALGAHQLRNVRDGPSGGTYWTRGGPGCSLLIARRTVVAERGVHVVGAVSTWAAEQADGLVGRKTARRTSPACGLLRLGLNVPAGTDFARLVRRHPARPVGTGLAERTVWPRGSHVDRPRAAFLARRLGSLALPVARGTRFARRGAIGVRPVPTRTAITTKRLVRQIVPPAGHAANTGRFSGLGLEPSSGTSDTRHRRHVVAPKLSTATGMAICGSRSV